MHDRGAVTTPLLLNHVPLQTPLQYRLSYSFNTTLRHTHAVAAHLNRLQHLLSRIPFEAVRSRQCYLHWTGGKQGQCSGASNPMASESAYRTMHGRLTRAKHGQQASWCLHGAGQARRQGLEGSAWHMQKRAKQASSSMNWHCWHMAVLTWCPDHALLPVSSATLPPATASP